MAVRNSNTRVGSKIFKPVSGMLNFLIICRGENYGLVNQFVYTGDDLRDLTDGNPDLKKVMVKLGPGESAQVKSAGTLFTVVRI